MKRPPVSIVVPVHGRPGVTVRCLEAVLATAPEAELVVVDDGSPQDLTAALSPLGGRFTLVEHESPLGYAAACNEGAATASGALLVFLNSDTVPRAGWLEPLVHAAETHPGSAAFGSRLLYPDGTVQHAGVVICGDRLPRHVYRGFPGEHPAVLRSRPLQVVTGACMLVRRDIFELAGGFDPAFRNGLEDVDLSLRLGELGFAVRYCAESVLVHLESVSLAGLPRRARAAEIAGNLGLYRERWAARVEPDDLRIYAEDGLVSFEYTQDRRPEVRVSPLLAELSTAERHTELELRRRERQVAELLGDLVDLTVAVAEAELDSGAAPAAGLSRAEFEKAQAGLAIDDELAAQLHDLQTAIAKRQTKVGVLPSRRLAYRALRRRIRRSLVRTIPAGASVLVASRGDEELVELDGLEVRHFPEGAEGVYAGHHPATDDDAIHELEARRRDGARYFVLPETMRWWLEHYEAFGAHIERYPRVAAVDGCAVYALEER